MTVQNFENYIYKIQGKTVAVVYIFEGEDSKGFGHYDIWQSDVISEWLGAIQQNRCRPLIMDVRTFIHKAMNNTLPHIDFVLNLNAGATELSTLSLVPSVCSFLGIPCIPCNAVSIISGEHKGIANYIAASVDLNLPSNVNNYGTAGGNKYYIEIVKSRLGKDFANNDVLIVRYKFMHTYDEPKAFGYVFDDKIYQNGIECKSTYWKSLEITEDYKYSEIQPNTVVEFETSYGLNDLYSPVDVQITKMFSKTVVFSQTINLK